MKMSPLFTAIIAVFSIGSLRAAEPAAATPALSADELAAKLDAVSQGSSSIRTQLEIRSNEGGKRVMQLQIKQRRTKDATDLAYLVIWPNDQKGKGVILHQKEGEVATGSVIEPPNKVRALQASEMSDGLFDSDLAYQDAVENFFAWKKQALVGTGTIDNVSCQILESKPGSSSETIYGKVRTWIDLRRMVPMRVEKYSPTGELVRRIDTDRVAPDDQHRQIPARLLVHGPRKNTVTELNGSGIKHDVNFTDADFTAASR
ncbi:MAG: outer membrane lipoprotein-sorting protein [Verrucomicrobiota bacterium]|nr:outer membrane lipoprotein-sorting protein [Verrucomicrobiota bacterium]